MNRMSTFLCFIFTLVALVTNAHAEIIISMEDFDVPGDNYWENDIEQHLFTDPNAPNQGLMMIDADDAYIESNITNPRFLDDVLYARDLLGESNDMADGELQSLSPYEFTFAEIDVSGYENVTLSFDYAVFAGMGQFGPVDEGFYEVFVDGVGLGRTNYFTSDNGVNIVADSGTIVENIGNAQTVGLVLSGALDGNTDVIQWDNFVLGGEISGVPEPMTAATFLISIGLITRRRRR